MFAFFRHTKARTIWSILNGCVEPNHEQGFLCVFMKILTKPDSISSMSRSGIDFEHILNQFPKSLGTHGSCRAKNSPHLISFCYMSKIFFWLKPQKSFFCHIFNIQRWFFVWKKGMHWLGPRFKVGVIEKVDKFKENLKNTF